MAGFLKKMFSFGKKEVVETPGLRTDGDELKPIDWAALRDLTKEDDGVAEAEAAKAAEEAAAKATAEEAARKTAEEEAAARAKAEEERVAEEAKRLAAEKESADAAKRAEEEEASRKAAEEEAARVVEAEAKEAARRATEEAAARKAAEDERIASEDAARAAEIEIAKAAEEAKRIAEESARRRAEEEEAAKEAAAAKLAEEAAAKAEQEAAREAAEAEARTAREAAERERVEAEEQAKAEAEARAEAQADLEAPRFPEPPEPELPEETPPEPDVPAAPPAEPEIPEPPAEPDLPEEIPPEPIVPDTPPEPEPAPAQPDVPVEPEIPDEPAPEPPAPAIVPPPPAPAPPPTASAYNPGLRTGGDELLAPAWMTQPAPQPKPAPAPPPPPAPEDPGNKVTVAKKVEQKLAPVAPQPEARIPWFQRLRMGLLKSSRELSSNIAGVFTKRKLDEDTLQDLEDVLLRADLGLEIAMRVTDNLSANRYGKEISDLEVRTVMGAEIEKVLKPVALPLELDLEHKPHVILVVGVNGTGKTTTIGKLAAKLKDGGLSVMLAAGDTFRAAAIEQLKIWGERTNSPVISSKLGADAAGLAYDAFEQAKEAGSDVLIIDTAGRLQNKTELMAELEKIVRVLGKLDPDAPHTVLQTIDATTGQNALNQVEIFRNVAGVNGLVLTKLDGTARGGILVAIAAKHKLPVYFIGVGEQIDDLEPFSAGDFAKAIAGVG